MTVDPRPHEMRCTRCDTELEYFGTKRLREGFTKSSPRSPGRKLHPMHGEHFDVYACTCCGHVELFVDGIGEEVRPH